MNIEKWLKKSLFSGILRFLPLALLASLADAGMLFGIQSFMDILLHKSIFTLKEWILVMFLITSLRFIFLFWKTKFSETYLFEIGANTTHWFIYSLRNLSPKFFHQADADSIVETAYDSTIVLQNNGIVFFQAIQATLQLTLFFPVLLYISWPLTLFLFAIIVPLVVFLQRKLHSMGKEEESLFHLRAEFRTILNKARYIYRNWSNQTERSLTTKALRNETRKLCSKGLKSSVKKNALSLIMESISVLSMVLVLSFCALLINKQMMDGTSLVMFCSAVLLCYKPIKECSRVLPQFRSAISAYNLLVKFNQLPKKSIPTKAFDNNIIINNAEFSYSNLSSHIFHHFYANIDDSIPLLLRGKNGVGKSTLLRLLALLEEWDFGEIKHTSKVRMHGVFYVAQNIELPSILMLKDLLKNIENFELKQFMEHVNIQKLLCKSGLSGGEKAKVALTWALASKAKVLLLDEPFASIALTERNVILKEFLNVAESLNKWIILASHDEIVQELESKFKILELKNE